MMPFDLTPWQFVGVLAVLAVVSFLLVKIAARMGRPQGEFNRRARSNGSRSRGKGRG